MITDTTAARLARDLIVYREMLSVALERLNTTQRLLAAREETVALLREELKRYTQEAVR